MSVCFARGFQARPFARICQALIPVLLLIGVTAAPALAQGDSDQHFGVGVSFSPSWKSRSDLLVTVGLDNVGTIEGSEFSIGFVRGRTRGGDWGVSFVRKPIKNKTSVFQETEAGECGPGCFFTSSSTETTTFQDVYLRGVEVHWSPVFVTISNRVQIGLTVAGGIGFPEGTIHQLFEQTQITTFQGQTRIDSFSESSTSPAKEVFFGKVPLFKVEAQGAVILAPGLKVRISGGLNNPGVGIRIGAVYLFGAN